MNTHTPNYGQSVKARLLNLAKQENIRYQQLVTRYFQERLLFRLSLSEYRTHFILKGGALNCCSWTIWHDISIILKKNKNQARHTI